MSKHNTPEKSIDLVEHRPPLWKQLLRILWQGRFLYLQVAIIAAAAWLLWPLRDAATLPDPAVPTLMVEPPDRQETLLVGTESFSPGTQGAVRVLVYDPDSREPMPGVNVQASITSPIESLAGEPVFAGETDEFGNAAIVFDIPTDAPGRYDLVVDTAGPVGAQRVIHPFVVQRHIKLDLSTDNVLYHPGQFIYLSLLASDGMTGIPLPDRPITFTVIDPRQNPIWSQNTTTSEFGLAAAGCELADKIDSGVYRVTAVLDVPGQVPVLVEKTVRVELVPSWEFALDIRTDSDIYMPGQRLSATVQIAERWGQPISGTQFIVQPILYIPTQHKLESIGGTTGADGASTLGFSLPENLPVTSEQTQIALGLVVEATAPDGRTANKEIRLPVTSQAIRVQIQAESDALKPGLDNIIQIQTTYPDNQPASCTIEIEANGQKDTLATDQDGLAKWHYAPTNGQPLSLHASAKDRSGHSGETSLNLALAPGTNHLLLRPKQNTITQDETILLDVFATHAEGVVYLDVLSREQTIATYSALLSQGHASLQIKAAPAGTLTLHAYTLLQDDTFIGDAKTVTVLPQTPLQFSAQAARTLYESGETAQVDIQVSDATGKGVPSALDIALVDVAQAGLPLYKSDSRPFWSGDGIDEIGTPAKLFVRYAGVLSKPRPVSDLVRIEFERIAAVRAERQQAFARLAETFITALVAASGLMWIVVLVWAWRAKKVTWRVVLSSLISAIVMLPLALGGTILLVHFGQQIFGPGTPIVLGLGWLGALLALLVHGWERGAGGVQLVPALLIAGLVLGWGLSFAIAQGGMPNPDRILIGAVALVAGTFALYLLGSGLARQSAWGSSIAAFATIVLVISSVLGVLLFGKAVHRERAVIPDLDIDLTPTSTSPAAPLSVSVSAPAAVPSRALLWQEQRWETLYWRPTALTDRQGWATLDIPIVQDSQLFVRASTLQGEHALAQVQFDVRPSLAIEAPLPTALTVDDVYELGISVNTIQPFSQSVQMTITQADWFRTPTRNTDTQTIDLPANEHARFWVPIQVREWGAQTLDITLSSTQTIAHTITRSVQVLPNGQPIIRHYNRQTDELDTYKIRIPWAAVRGSDRIAVRIYPGWSSILAEGLQSALAHRELGEWVSRQVISPTQVSPSVPYPTPFAGDALDQLLAETNHLLLLRDHLIRSQKWTTRFKTPIERALALNGQRLLTFEADQDGFSTFGQSGGELVQTASALMSLSKLETIDQRIIERIAGSLLARQTSSGTWHPIEWPAGWQQLPRPDLAFTAYVTWALIDAGYGNKQKVQDAVTYLARYQDQAQDPYTLALIIHTLAAYRDGDPTGTSDHEALALAASRLADMAEIQEGLAIWRDNLQTFGGTIDNAADVERTALATSALLRAQIQPDLVAQGLALLADWRDAFGTWGSPQTTYWALRAFATALQTDPVPVLPAQEATVSVSVGALRSDDQDTSPRIVIPAHSENDTVYHFNFDAPAKGYNDVQIEVNGGPIFYQLIAEYVLPWNQVPPPAPGEELVSLALSYDRTSLDVGQMVAVTAGINLNRPGVAPLVALNLGLPPGVEPVMQEWQDMLEVGLIAHYERTETHIRAYLVGLSNERPVNLVYHLQSRTPCTVLSQPTWALEIANPQPPTWREPVKIEVKEPQ